MTWDISITELQQKFPNPISANDIQYPPHCDTHYCVGGAFILAAWEQGFTEVPFQPNGEYPVRFPDDMALADSLHHILGLPNDRAEEYAMEITNYNDSGEFDAAWRELEYAIREAQS